MGVQTTVMVGWRKSLLAAAQTYLVELGGETVWFGRLGKGGAYWGPTPGLPDYTLRQTSRVGGSSVIGGAAGMALGQAGARKVLERYRAEIAENERRYHLEGRAALSGDNRTMEWPLTEFAGARLVKRLPFWAPPATQSLGPGFVEVRLGRKIHYFAGLPESNSADEFHAALVETMQR